MKRDSGHEGLTVSNRSRYFHDFFCLSFYKYIKGGLHNANRKLAGGF